MILPSGEVLTWNDLAEHGRRMSALMSQHPIPILSAEETKEVLADISFWQTHYAALGTCTLKLLYATSRTGHRPA